MIELVPKQILTQILAFLIMLWILKRYAWTPLLAILDDRKRLIQSIYDEAWKTKARAENTKKEYEEQLQSLKNQAQEIIQNAVNEAKQIASDLEEKSQIRAKEIIENAHRQSDRDLQKAKIELKKEMIGISFLALEKLIHVKLKPEERDQFAFEMLEKL